MFEEIWEEGKDFFEDIVEHLLEKEKYKHRDPLYIQNRTKLAYQFTERVDSLIKIIFGFSIFISAIVSTVWGFTAMGDMVKMLLTSAIGRFLLVLIGVSYTVNGIWRLLHRKQ